MADDEVNEAGEDEDDEEEDVEEGVTEAEDWEGIESEAEDEEEGDEESFELGSDDDNEPPLQWDDLFDQAVGEASGGDVEASDDEVSQEGNESIDAVSGEPKLSAKAAGKKRSESHPNLSPSRWKSTDFWISARAIDDVATDESSPEKAPRMTTNKKKASNFFTTANVKNK